ncbi:hypothetical protein FEA48_23435 [Pseudomonas nitroreducens]|uniref:Uncharacterized protein n=1 Tax=Pseudomonas nitroreducens TaxID=46680 RepID=A0A5R8ZWX2_PSENT|nr:hypothetical protein [Pseudomonas nitroreducens]TLP70790.1 hypothetical protein FEA48_23435 [Pseudomonas nitroreducens]
MAKVTITLEDTPSGMSLDMRRTVSGTREHLEGTPAQLTSNKVLELINFEMALQAIPSHRQQWSNTIH